MAINTVKLKVYSNVFEEYTAGAAINPGEWLDLNASGNVILHGTAGGAMTGLVALEDSLQGNGLTDAYASGDQVQCWIPGAGDQVYTILADGENVAIGDYLESDGNGQLRALASGVAVAQALEAVDASDSAATALSDRRIKVRKL